MKNKYEYHESLFESIWFHAFNELTAHFQASYVLGYAKRIEEGVPPEQFEKAWASLVEAYHLADLAVNDLEEEYANDVDFRIEFIDEAITDAIDEIVFPLSNNLVRADETV